MCFFLSAARIWTTEHNQVIKLTAELEAQTQPQFACTIDQTFTPTVQTSVTPQSGSLVILIAFVKNVGAPSAAEGYEVKAEMMDKTVVVGKLVTIPPSLPVVFPNGFTRNISSSQALYNKTASPLAHNAFTRGYLIAAFDISQQRLSASASQWILSFVDINNKPSTCSLSPAFQGGPNTDLSFPGLDQ